MSLTLKRVYIHLLYQDQIAAIRLKKPLILSSDFEERIRGLLDQFGLECEMKNLILPAQYYELYHREFGNLPLLLEMIHQLEPAYKTLFGPNDEVFEWLSAEYLLQALKDYLAQKITPLQMCTLIQIIESAMMNISRLLPEKMAYYPLWLGDLWNQCDWCDESWEFKSQPDLATATHAQIEEITKWLQDHRQMVE